MANGYQALYSNTTGGGKTANGNEELFSKPPGRNNRPNRYQPLYPNTTGGGNTANGNEALFSNTTGIGNTAFGNEALFFNTTGGNNMANGYQALYSNTTGGGNTANGSQTLIANTTGGSNTANGYGALAANTTGGSNIAIGMSAGSNLTTGNNNIDIFDSGVAAEGNTIRIGTQSTQTTTFVAGIFGATVTGSAVVVNSSGQLGVAPSSQRYKRDIQDMGLASEAILALRPVTFRYKPEIDPTGTRQFGLVAEEVEKISPDLVVHDAQHQIYTVRYEAVNAMLLNEFRKQHEQVAEQAKTIARQENEIAVLRTQFEALTKAVANR